VLQHLHLATPAAFTLAGVIGVAMLLGGCVTLSGVGDATIPVPGTPGATMTVGGTGIELTSEPAGATVEVTVSVYDPADPGKKSAPKTTRNLTPYRNSNGHFTKSGNYNGIPIAFAYTFKVTKPGYDTIVENQPGAMIADKHHWVLKPKR
jgi:hypothetical protein